MTTVEQQPDSDAVTVTVSPARGPAAPASDKPRPSPNPRRPVMAGPAPVPTPVPSPAERTTRATPMPVSTAAQVKQLTEAADAEAATQLTPLPGEATRGPRPEQATRAVAPVKPAATPAKPPAKHSAPSSKPAEPPTTAIPEPATVLDPPPVDPARAEEFLRLFYAETSPTVPFGDRLRQVRAEIDRSGVYSHTTDELTFGARVAWRNSARCIGRLYWRSLQVRDLRHLHDPADVAQESVGHLRAATRHGRVRSTITVFAPDGPGRPGPRIHNDQLVRYAGHRNPDGSVVGDPLQVPFTDRVVALGWPRPAPRGRFDVLPLLVTGGDGRTRLFDMPPDAVHEVRLRHPEYPWFAELGLRWYSVPAISNMPLEIGGVRYPAAPFNGWYLDTEIGARNLADTDRYDMLPEIAERLGLDTSTVRTMWRDRALVELVRAVTHSYDVAGVTMSDHHTESDRFLTHVERERSAGRRCPADWSWIVPPVSGGLTPVFHRYYDPPDPRARPAFLPPPGTA